MVNSGFVEMYRHVTEDGMRDYLGGAPDPIELASAMEFVDGLRSGEIVVEQQQAAAVSQIGTIAEKCLPYLLNRRWHLVSTETELVLTDEPVLLLGGPGWPRGQLAGVGSARIVAMPLSPRHLLVLTSTDVLDDGRYDEQLTVDETEEINLELLVNAHRWLFSTPKRTARLPVIPPPTPPWILERGISIADQPAGELLHGFSPNRWLYADRTPWPVGRWWDGQADSKHESDTFLARPDGCHYPRRNRGLIVGRSGYANDPTARPPGLDGATRRHAA